MVRLVDGGQHEPVNAWIMRQLKSRRACRSRLSVCAAQPTLSPMPPTLKRAAYEFSRPWTWATRRLKSASTIGFVF